MAFCKVCPCGNKVVFQKVYMAPDECPFCGRRLITLPAFNENSEEVKRNLQKYSQSTDENESKSYDEDEYDNIQNQDADLYLVSENGERIYIPAEGGIIGRTEIGAEILAKYPSVSKHHIKVYYTFKKALLVEDISSYGTFIDGRKMEKNISEHVNPGVVIRLCNVDFTLQKA